MIAVGGIWTVAERTGLQPLGFDSTIALLTSVHFHYAGFLLLLTAGWAARELGSSAVGKLTCVCVMLGVPLTALGILAGHWKWNPALEAAAATFMAAAGWMVAWLHLRLAARGDAVKSVRVLWTIASASLFFGMALAVLYALRAFVQVPKLDIPYMRAIHGTLNAFGFALCGVAGWRLQRSGQVRGEAE
ncbi:MAG: YndJ family transporter [Pirellulales bacterium]